MQIVDRRREKMDWSVMINKLIYDSADMFFPARHASRYLSTFKHSTGSMFIDDMQMRQVVGCRRYSVFYVAFR